MGSSLKEGARHQAGLCYQVEVSLRVGACHQEGPCHQEVLCHPADSCRRVGALHQQVHHLEHTRQPALFLACKEVRLASCHHRLASRRPRCLEHMYEHAAPHLLQMPAC